MQNLIHISILILVLWCPGVPCAFSAEVRPASWAVPLMDPKIPNLHQLTPHLYRCAQPDAAGMQALDARGIKTVINLRAFHNDRAELRGTGLLNEELSINTWNLEDEDVIRVLVLVSDERHAPFVIHCHHGADRTGVMCALYRVVVQDWTKAEAIREMTEGGFGFWPGWKNLITYVEQVDVERLRRAIAAQSRVTVPAAAASANVVAPAPGPTPGGERH
jgi:protein tyrosine/serine phosphatase